MTVKTELNSNYFWITAYGFEQPYVIQILYTTAFPCLCELNYVILHIVIYFYQTLILVSLTFKPWSGFSLPQLVWKLF